MLRVLCSPTPAAFQDRRAVKRMLHADTLGGTMITQNLYQVLYTERRGSVFYTDLRDDTKLSRYSPFILNLPLASHHSITSSARASNVGGTLRPSAFAVLRLMKATTWASTSARFAPAGLTSSPTRISPGTASCASSTSFAFTPSTMLATPVTLPPGRA